MSFQSGLVDKLDREYRPQLIHPRPDELETHHPVPQGINLEYIEKQPANVRVGNYDEVIRFAESNVNDVSRFLDDRVNVDSEIAQLRAKSEGWNMGDKENQRPILSKTINDIVSTRYANIQKTYVAINSALRDKTSSLYPNHYRMTFDRTFTNVQEIRLTEFRTVTPQPPINRLNNKIAWNFYFQEWTRWDELNFTNAYTPWKERKNYYFEAEIPEGYYTTDELQKELENQMNHRFFKPSELSPYNSYFSPATPGGSGYENDVNNFKLSTPSIQVRDLYQTSPMDSLRDNFSMLDPRFRAFLYPEKGWSHFVCRWDEFPIVSLRTEYGLPWIEFTIGVSSESTTDDALFQKNLLDDSGYTSVFKDYLPTNVKINGDPNYGIYYLPFPIITTGFDNFTKIPGGFPKDLLEQIQYYHVQYTMMSAQYYMDPLTGGLSLSYPIDTVISTNVPAGGASPGTLVGSFTTDVGTPLITAIPGGSYYIPIPAKVDISSSTEITTLTAYLYYTDASGTVETLIGSSTPETIYYNDVFDSYQLEIVVSTPVNVLVTDRIRIKLYALHSGTSNVILDTFYGYAQADAFYGGYVVTPIDTFRASQVGGFSSPDALNDIVPFITPVYQYPGTTGSSGYIDVFDWGKYDSTVVDVVQYIPKPFGEWETPIAPVRVDGVYRWHVMYYDNIHSRYTFPVANSSDYWTDADYPEMKELRIGRGAGFEFVFVSSQVRTEQCSNLESTRNGIILDTNLNEDNTSNSILQLLGWPSIESNYVYASGRIPTSSIQKSEFVLASLYRQSIGVLNNVLNQNLELVQTSVQEPREAEAFYTPVMPNWYPIVNWPKCIRLQNGKWAFYTNETLYLRISSPDIPVTKVNEDFQVAQALLSTKDPANSTYYNPLLTNQWLYNRVIESKQNKYGEDIANQAYSAENPSEEVLQPMELVKEQKTFSGIWCALNIGLIRDGVQKNIPLYNATFIQQTLDTLTSITVDIVDTSGRLVDLRSEHMIVLEVYERIDRLRETGINSKTGDISASVTIPPNGYSADAN